MPDWTYQPLRPFAEAVLGERRTRVWALRVLAVLITRAGGSRWIPALFGHPPPLPNHSGRLGVSVPPQFARDAITVLPVQGASVIEISPVSAPDRWEQVWLFSCISMLGWRRGQSWVWWCLLLGWAFATVPVLIVHFTIGYTHFEHLAPVYVLVAATATALALSKPYLTATERETTIIITAESASA